MKYIFIVQHIFNMCGEIGYVIWFGAMHPL